MFFIPGILITFVTFPGVIVHELAHQLFCRIFKVAVFEVKYFQFSNPAGYVIHEKPSKQYQHLLIAVGPFILNSILGALIALPAAYDIMTFSDTSNMLNYILAWLGVSIAMHSFPSTVDAKSIWDMLKESDTPLYLKIVGYPIVSLIYLGALGSVIWIDFIYAIFICTIFPKLMFSLII